MANEPAVEREAMDGDFETDPEARARQIDALMAGPPAELPSILVFGDEAVFGLRPLRRPN